MRTTLDLDEAAVKEAMAAAPGRTKTSIINEALRDFARHHRLLKLHALRGSDRWEGDLDELRKRA
jgi:Arc/MetJ family transcription regulator